jgi:hypothetical protein
MERKVLSVVAASACAIALWGVSGATGAPVPAAQHAATVVVPNVVGLRGCCSVQRAVRQPGVHQPVQIGLQQTVAPDDEALGMPRLKPSSRVAVRRAVFMRDGQP